MAETGHSAGEYIAHHLQNLTVCKKDGDWVWNECHGNFWALNVDSMFFSVVLGILLIWFFSRVAKKASTGIPTKTQALIEVIVDFVDRSVRDTFSHPPKSTRHRAARADALRLDPADEPDGPDPGGLAALGGQVRGRRVPARRADDGRQRHVRDGASASSS